MLSLILTATLALVVFYIGKNVYSLRNNLAIAKSSGIPYKIVPVFIVNRKWQTSQPLSLPLLNSLPKSWTESWLPLCLEWGWKRRYAPFANVGSDTFLTVSPGRIVLNTAEASVISQITQRRNDFPKELKVYGMLKIYGSNMVVTEGQEWRHQRKIASPQFNEANNRVVWQETLNQAQAMVKSWFGKDEARSSTIRTLTDDAMRISLHIISKAGFGVHLDWPGAKGGATETTELKNGHTMTYTTALGEVLEHIIAVIVMPKWLLKRLPFETTKTAYESYFEWNRYMWEIFDDKKAQILAGKDEKSMDLMTALLRGAGVTADDHEAKRDKPPQQTLTDQEIIGNAFVFILAGHETTANSIHFCLVYLAMNVASQRRLQKDLDETFNGRPVSEWDYDKDISQLFGNMAGAVMNEELRLIPPVTSIPKCTEPGKPQQLVVGGKKCMVPGGTYISLMPHAAHRNPNQWPTTEPADPNNPSHPYSNRDNDLEEFKPERWFLKNKDDNDKSTRDIETTMTSPQSATSERGSLSINMAPDTAPSMFRPEKGAYIPFSEGFRSCIGRRFAQVELLAFIAFVFTHYSVELSVEDWASDEEVAKMDRIGKREVWEKAKAKVEKQMIYDMYSVITLQLRRGHIPLRLVKRGNEMFDWQ